MRTQPHPPDAGAPPKKRGGCGKVLLIALAVVVGLGLLGLLFGGGDDAATDEPPAPEPTRVATEESEPEPEPEGPTQEDIEAYIAASTGSGATTYAEACAADVGLGWVCNVEYADPIGSTLEVRVRTIEPGGPDGDRIARNFYNFLTGDLVSDSPMPDVSFVQVTTAQEGEVGSYRNW